MNSGKPWPPETIFFTIIATARGAAVRWLVAIVLLCAAGVRAVEPPVVITRLITNATPTSATLNGAINSRGQSATAWFIWGKVGSYDQVTPAQPMATGISLSNFSETITGLSKYQYYYYRAVGSNAQGQVVLGFDEYIYLAEPAVNTGSAGGITTNLATLSGNINAQLINLPTHAWFEWGPAPNFDHATPVRFISSGIAANFVERITGLEPGTAYYFRAVASNVLGVAIGRMQPLYTDSAVSCPGFISPEKRQHGYAGGTEYQVLFRGGCSGAVTNTNSWLTITSPTNDFGLVVGTILSYNVAPNPDPRPRTGAIMMGGHSFWITQAAGHPVIVTQPSNQTVSAGSTATLTVNVIGENPAFQWRFGNTPLYDGNGIFGATSSNLVLADVQLSQAGEYRVLVSDADLLDTTYSSFATLTVVCTNSLSPSNASFGPFSAGDFVTLNGFGRDCAWSVVNTNPWVVVLSSVTNRGNGSVVYAVAENPATTARSGNLLIADRVFTITQSGGSPTNPDVSFEEALDTEGTLSWWTIGTPAWLSQKLVSHDGVDAAQSGPITNSSAVTAMSILNGPGTLSFWWKVSSETNKDYLKFFLNGVQQTRISGEVDWQLLSFSFASGTYTSKWTYSKNDQGTVGNDRGWLDQVRFDPDATACPVKLSAARGLHSTNASSGFVNVAAGAGCTWSVLNTNPWISVVSGAIGRGNGSVNYTVAADPTNSVRRGYLQIADQSFLVHQSTAGTNAPWLQFMARTATKTTLSVQGAPGKMYILEGSEDLVRWKPLSTNPAPSLVTDATAGNKPQRFYRTVEIP